MQAAHTQASAKWMADPRFAGDGYVLLDTLRVEPDDLRRDNAAALLAGLENLTPETAAPLVAWLHERVRLPELGELKEVMLAWAAWSAKRRLGIELEVDAMAAVVRPEDYEDAEAYHAARLQAWQEEYRAEGRVEGQRALLTKQAALKFDAETATGVAELLEGVTDQNVFDGVLAAIVKCETSAEVLETVAEVCRRERGHDVPDFPTLPGA